MVYRETVTLEKEVLERVNALLAIKDLGDLTEKEKSLNPQTDDFIGLISVDFENGNVITIDVCSGTGNYYDNCVLIDGKTENEITCFDCNYSIDNEMEFNYGNDTYIITINTTTLAKEFVTAIKTIAGKPENLALMENYLSYHFNVWVKTFANNPEGLVRELKEFAEMKTQTGTAL